ncbi:hypothetical protein CDD83_2765 [Cordyceps sp. RAO-2017]|nr:hypothetical protein CDD83_2765 [Cordyceps sp. RAO-2017]
MGDVLLPPFRGPRWPLTAPPFRAASDRLVRGKRAVSSIGDTDTLLGAKGAGSGRQMRANGESGSGCPDERARAWVRVPMRRRQDDEEKRQGGGAEGASSNDEAPSHDGHRHYRIMTEALESTPVPPQEAQ